MLPEAQALLAPTPYPVRPSTSQSYCIVPTPIRPFAPSAATVSSSVPAIVVVLPTGSTCEQLLGAEGMEVSPITCIGTLLANSLLLLAPPISRDTPAQWGSDGAGYGRRLASICGQSVIQNSLSTAGNAALGYEPRYDRCRCSGLWPRTRHAILRNFATYNKSEEQLRPQFGLYGAAFASGVISSTWKPQSDLWGQGYHSMLTQAGFGIVSIWIAEFAPETVHALGGNPTHDPKK